jgi:hypothetical protein
MGPDDLIHRLEQPDIVGKEFSSWKGGLVRRKERKFLEVGDGKAGKKIKR